MPIDIVLRAVESSLCLHPVAQQSRYRDGCHGGCKSKSKKLKICLSDIANIYCCLQKVSLTLTGNVF